MRFTERFVLRLIESIGSISAVCGILWVIMYKFNLVCTVPILKQINVSDMYFTQISVAFIIISLVSVLTTVSRPVYWVDITQFKLIEPQHTAFIDFAAYILGSLIISSIFLMFNSNYMLISFGFSIIFMMLLTIKMIGAYFGRDSVKLELQKEFHQLKQENVDNFAENDKETNKSKKKKKIDEKERFKNCQKYFEICSELEDKTYQEIDNKEYKLVSENLDLLVSNDEYDIVIDILRYISENMVNIYCKYAKKYLKNIMNYKPENYSQDHQNRYFQLVYTNLMRSIEEDDIQEVSVCLYSVLLKGRNAQFTQEELENKRIYTRGQYWERIEPLLSEVYKKCISEDKYDLLDEFLYAFYKEQLAFRRMLCNMHDKNNDIVNRLFSRYSQKLGMETITQRLAEKVSEKQIDYRQTTMLVGSITKIYHEIEVNREKNRDVLTSEQLSRMIYDESYVRLIQLAYENELIDEKMSKKYAVNESSELQGIYKKIISNK